MKKVLFISICILSFCRYANAQDSTANVQDTLFENITYKTKQPKANKTFMEKAFSDNSKQAIPKERTTTAKILVKGKASLYEVDDYPSKYDVGIGTKPFYFIKTEKGTYALLHNNQTGEYVVNQPYRSMLMFSLQGWDDKENAIKQTAYTTEALSWLIKEYNKAVEPASK